MPNAKAFMPIALTLAGLLTMPACAVPTREPTLAERYVRMRAAAIAGDMRTSTAELAVLMAHDPADTDIARLAMRDAIAAGDEPLALKAARVLDARQALPTDGPLLFVVDAIQAKDWARARAEINRLEAGKLFAFMAPMLRAWIALGAGDGDPLAMLDAGRSSSLASAYLPAQRALLLFAIGRVDEGVAEVRSMRTPGSRLSLVAAAALLDRNRNADVATLLAGSEPALMAARAQVAAGRRIGISWRGPGTGVSELFSMVALDFNRQRVAPVAMILARLATFADPTNAGAWISTGSLLGTAKRPEAALAALGHVGPDDPYASAAETLRIGLKLDGGDKAGALAEARAAAERTGAGAAELSRLGDVHMALDQPREAAMAYDKALAAIGLQAPADVAWPLWLQRGAALEQAGDWPAAKAALRRALALAPDQAVVLNHLGYAMLSRREDLAEASQLIAAASRLRPDDPAITDSLGWARFVRGDAAGAATLLERATASEPGEPTINEHLGDVYWALGRRIEARYAWRAALVTAEAKDGARIRSKIETAPTPETAAP